MLLRQSVSVLILPFNVLLVIPSLLFLRCRGKRAGLAPIAALPLTRGLGGLLIMAAVPMLFWTIREFGRSGRGTLAPWDRRRSWWSAARIGTCATR